MAKIIATDGRPANGLVCSTCLERDGVMGDDAEVESVMATLRSLMPSSC